jgi:hypothetical protein
MPPAASRASSSRRVLAYGGIIRNPADPARYIDLAALKALQTEAGVRRADRRHRADPHPGRGVLEGDALLSRDIRFFYQPNSAELDGQREGEPGVPRHHRGFLQVSPGSIVVLRGHVDNARVGEFEQQGGQALVRSMALKAMELSRQRAESVRDACSSIRPSTPTGSSWSAAAGKSRPARQRAQPPRRGAVVHAGVRVDAWLVLVSLPALYFLLVHPLRGFLDGDPQSPGWLVAALWAVTALLVAVSWPLRYVIDAEALHIHMGIVRWRIPLAQIDAIEPSRALWRGPALSLRRLAHRLSHGSVGAARVFISPRDREAFIDDLVARAKDLRRGR